MQHIAFLKENQGWANTVSLSVLKVGTIEECRKIITDYNTDCSHIESESEYNILCHDRKQAFLESEGLDAEDAQESIENNFKYEGEGFYDFSEIVPKFSGKNRYENDLKEYYITTIDSLNDIEIGEMIEDRFTSPFIDQEFAEMHGIKDQEGVYIFDVNKYSNAHSGSTESIIKYFYNNQLLSEYPETENTEKK